MDKKLRELASNLLGITNIKETNTGIIKFISSTLQSPKLTRVTLRLPPDHPED